MEIQETITQEQKEKTKKASIFDGAFHTIQVAFGEQFVTPFAIRLSASNVEIGILSSFPSFFAALFQIISAKVTDTLKKRRLLILFCVFIQGFMWLPMFLVPFFTKSVLLLTIIFSIYVLLGSFMVPAWNSLIGDILNENERGKFFGKRNKIINIVSFFSILIAGLFLNYTSNFNVWLGFAILFLVAMISRFISFYYLTKYIEPMYIVEEKDYFTFVEFIKKLPKTNFGKFVIFRSLFAFAIMIASPFFTVYMLKYLGFSYLKYTIIVLTPLAVKFLTTTYWGKYSDIYGSKRIMTVSALLIYLIPVIWLIAAVFNGNFFIIMFAEAVSGFGWAGFELSSSMFLFDAVHPRKRARCVAYFSVIFGTMVFLGGLSGGILSTVIPFGVYSMLILFLLSAIFRLLVQVIFMPKIKEERVSLTMDERKLFVEMVAVRPTRHLFIETLSGIIKIEDELKKIEHDGFDFMSKEMNIIKDKIKRKKK